MLTVLAELTRVTHLTWTFLLPQVENSSTELVRFINVPLCVKEHKYLTDCQVDWKTFSVRKQSLTFSNVLQNSILRKKD
jgi:hypothetical protein